MGKSKDKDDDVTALIVQAVAFVVGFLVSWWKSSSDEKKDKG